MDRSEKNVMQTRYQRLVPFRSMRDLARGRHIDDGLLTQQQVMDITFVLGFEPEYVPAEPAGLSGYEFNRLFKGIPSVERDVPEVKTPLTCYVESTIQQRLRELDSDFLIDFTPERYAYAKGLMR